MTDLSQSGISGVVEVASRKGISLDIRLTPHARRGAEEAAASVGAEVGQIVKSVVFVAPRNAGPLTAIVCLISGRNQVDLSRLAAVGGFTDIRAATAREALDLTGYSVGSIPPFGYAPDMRIVMDQDLCGYPWVWANAGSDGSVFRVAPRTLQMLSNALVAPVAKTPRRVAGVPARTDPRLQLTVA